MANKSTRASILTSASRANENVGTSSCSHRIMP